MRHVYRQEGLDYALQAVAKEVGRNCANPILFMFRGVEILWRRGTFARASIIPHQPWVVQEPNSLLGFPIYRYDRPGD